MWRENRRLQPLQNQIDSTSGSVWQKDGRVQQQNLMYYRHIFLVSLLMFPKMRRNRRSTTQSKRKDVLCVDKRRNDLDSQILSLRDKSAMSGENNVISSSGANLRRSVEHWRRLALLRSGYVEPNRVHPLTRFLGRRAPQCWHHR